MPNSRQATLDAFTDDAEASRIPTLECTLGRLDLVLRQMTEMMLPSVDASQSFPELFLDYFRLLFCAHVAQLTSGPERRCVRVAKTGSTPALM